MDKEPNPGWEKKLLEELVESSTTYLATTLKPIIPKVFFLENEDIGKVTKTLSPLVVHKKPVSTYFRELVANYIVANILMKTGHVTSSCKKCYGRGYIGFIMAPGKKSTQIKGVEVCPDCLKPFMANGVQPKNVKKLTFDFDLPSSDAFYESIRRKILNSYTNEQTQP